MIKAGGALSAAFVLAFALNQIKHHALYLKHRAQRRDSGSYFNQPPRFSSITVLSA